MNDLSSDCPFCLQNNLLTQPILARTDGAYLVENIRSKGNYLIVPEGHIDSFDKLPDDWWRMVKDVLPHVPGDLKSYNISVNYGTEAGQTIPHLHFWVVPRYADRPSTGKGLARLITEADS